MNSIPSDTYNVSPNETLYSEEKKTCNGLNVNKRTYNFFEYKIKDDNTKKKHRFVTKKELNNDELEEISNQFKKSITIEKATQYDEVAAILSFDTFEQISQKFGKDVQVAEKLCIFTLSQGLLQDISYNDESKLVGGLCTSAKKALQFLNENGQHVKIYKNYEFTPDSSYRDQNILQAIIEICPNLEELEITFHDDDEEEIIQTDIEEAMHGRILEVCKNMKNLKKLGLAGARIKLNDCKSMLNDDVSVYEFTP